MENKDWFKPESQFEIPLGAAVRDRVTGFEGVAISRGEYLTGCTQYGIAPKSTDGQIKGAEYLDWQRLEFSSERTGLEDIIVSKVTLQGNGPGDAPGKNKLAPR